MIVVGVDPGKTGAVARYNGDTGVLDLWRDFGHEHDLIAAVVEASEGCRHAAIELVHSMPKQGVVSSFTFGYWTGAAIGACKAKNLTISRPTPQTWQKETGTSSEGSRRSAMLVFPSYQEFFRRVKDHNSGDAAMIAWWLYQKLQRPLPTHDEVRSPGHGLSTKL